MNRADQNPRVDNSARHQRRHADGAQRRKPSRHVPGLRRPRHGRVTASRGKQKHQRHQAPDPRRRRKEMQRIGGNVQVADGAQRRAGVSRPGDRGGQAERRRKSEPIRPRTLNRQTSGQNDRQQAAYLPDQPELRLVQHRPQHARGHGLTGRQSAHRDGLKQKPNHPRQRGNGQTDPGDTQRLGPHQFGSRFGIESGLRHHGSENHGSGRQCRRAKVDRTNCDQGYVDPCSEPVHFELPTDRPET